MSIIEKPTDGRAFQCHGTAYDFFQNSDVAIKMCTRITTPHFFTIFHELGHIYYYLLYKDQPIAYRKGANPGKYQTHVQSKFKYSIIYSSKHPYRIS